MRKERKCEIEGCERKHEARGLCKHHYMILRSENALPGESTFREDVMHLRKELPDDIKDAYNF